MGPGSDYRLHMVRKLMLMHLEYEKLNVFEIKSFEVKLSNDFN